MIACITGGYGASNATAAEAPKDPKAPEATGAPKTDSRSYDLVISGGRVMDPESGLDAIRNVGIRDGKVRAITTEPLASRHRIEARGLVVAPGFIDLHEHGQEARNYGFQARDGVTTSLELELGTDDVAQWYAAREDHALINYGVSVGHIPARVQATTGMAHSGLADLVRPEVAAANHRELTAAEQARLDALLETGFRAGALAEGMGITYTPGASHAEIIAMFRLAAAHGASVHVHLRYASLLEPQSSVAALEEVIAAAAVSGAKLHVVHITSMGMRYTPELLAMIAGARQRGIDASVECYPYMASSTELGSAAFDPGWQEARGVGYGDLQWAATGERLTAESFERYRRQGGMVVVHGIPAAAARAAIADPLVMIASDGLPITGPHVHPRGQGTFARVLGHYVREEHALDLMTALRKMTLMPAQRLEGRAPMFHDKGRIREGADADLTIFDPERVTDRATFEQPLEYSEGIPYVLVNGVPVVERGRLVPGVQPGKPARAPMDSSQRNEA